MYHVVTRKAFIMSQDIHEGRWLQIRGRARRAWARLVGSEELAAQANAEVVAGALQESYGVAKKEAAREVSRGVDTIAGAIKRAARKLSR
jgi:uncharacterized protein YjbJ (UPF0337 family)